MPPALPSVQLDVAALSAGLHACLCSESEAQELRARQGSLSPVEDPFRQWPTIAVRHYIGTRMR